MSAAAGPRPEWWEVTTREDLDDEARHLMTLALGFDAERRRWTHPARRADLAYMAERLRDFAHWAHHIATTDTDDPWVRLEVMADALNLRAAGVLTLLRVERRREYEQGDGPRPERARLYPVT